MLTRREQHDARQILARLGRWDVALVGDGVVTALQHAVEILTDVEAFLSALLHPERRHTMTRLEDIADALDLIATDMAHLAPPVTEVTIDGALRAYAVGIATVCVRHQADHLRQIAGVPTRHDQHAPEGPDNRILREGARPTTTR
jgi:hypothetical protein